MGVASNLDTSSPQTADSGSVKPWSSISSQDTFKTMPYAEQEQTREAYFDRFLSSKIPDAERESAKTTFTNATRQKDIDAGITTPPDPTLDAAIGMGQAVGEGFKKGAANLVGGLVKTGATIDKYAHLTSPEAEQQVYSDINEGKNVRDANVSQAEKDHPIATAIGEAAPQVGAFVATAPEVAPIEGAGMLKNAGIAGLKAAPSAGVTQAAVSNAPTAQGKVGEGETAAILTPLLTTGGAGIGAALKQGQMATQYLTDLFTKSGQDSNVLKNILKTGYGGATDDASANFAQDINAAQQQHANTDPNGVSVNPTTTVLPAAKQVAQETNKATGAALQQKESEAATLTAQNIQGKFNNPQAQQSLQGEVSQVLGSSAKGQQDLTNIARSNPSTGDISSEENAKMTGVARSLQTERNNAYTAALEAGNKIPVHTEELSNALDGLNADDVLSKVQTKDVNLGLLTDKDGFVKDGNGNYMFDHTPSLTDVRELTKRIDTQLSNVNAGKSSVFTTAQQVEDAGKLKDALGDIKNKIIEQQEAVTPGSTQTLNPEKYANENYYSYLKNERPVTPTASPATGEIPSNLKESPDFLENAVGKWNNDRNSPNAKEATQTLEQYFDKAGPEGAAAVKDLAKFRPDSPAGSGATTSLGDYFTSKALEQGTQGKLLDPDAVDSYVSSRKDAINALPPAIRDKVMNVTSFFSKSARNFKGNIDDLQDFANWASGKESNAVFDSALKNEGALNDLYDKFKSVNDTKGFNSVLQSRFLEANQLSDKIPSLSGSNKNAFIQVNTLSPKLVGDIVTKSNAQGSLYPVASKLFGSDFSTLEKAVDNINSLEYNMPNIKPTEGSEEQSALGELPKLAAYKIGLRYGTISGSSKLAGMLVGKGTSAAQLRVLGDLNYAKAVNAAFKARNTDGIVKLITGNMGGTAAIAGQIGDKYDQSHSPNVNATGSPSSSNTNVNRGLPANTELQGQVDGQPDNSLSPKKTLAEDDMQTFGKNDTISRTIDTFEGGYVNNPADKGGPTNMGITLSTLKSVNPDATVNDVKNLSKDEAVNIYDKLYWQRYGIDKMPEAIQDVAFDTYVQHSPQTATKLIQQALNDSGQNVTEDGQMGEDTIKAMNDVAPAVLRANLLAARKEYYENKVSSNPTQKQFLKGWLNRLDALS